MHVATAVAVTVVAAGVSLSLAFNRCGFQAGSTAGQVCVLPAAPPGVAKGKKRKVVAEGPPAGKLWLPAEVGVADALAALPDAAWQRGEDAAHSDDSVVRTMARQMLTAALAGPGAWAGGGDVGANGPPATLSLLFLCTTLPDLRSGDGALLYRTLARVLSTAGPSLAVTVTLLQVVAGEGSAGVQPAPLPAAHLDFSAPTTWACALGPACSVVTAHPSGVAAEGDPLSAFAHTGTRWPLRLPALLPLREAACTLTLPLCAAAPSPGVLPVVLETVWEKGAAQCAVGDVHVVAWVTWRDVGAQYLHSAYGPVTRVLPDAVGAPRTPMALCV